jgi:hypothetical protein
LSDDGGLSLSEHGSEQAKSYGENNKDLGHVWCQFTESKDMQVSGSFF